ncbi:hypothetical protein Glove_169g58 [Diversispora epigaea]|uniref:Uncharacterized protein n=1 Tax=Diversispora epigaea TaxID=1348612 RepID=A0A397IYE4_9GLOM|nr:hypothetical protein Glove_169g58 [Diversispora epigaea]
MLKYFLMITPNFLLLANFITRYNSTLKKQQKVSLIYLKLISCSKQKGEIDSEPGKELPRKNHIHTFLKLRNFCFLILLINFVNIVISNLSSAYIRLVRQYHNP